MSEVSKSELLKELEEKVAKLHEQTEVTREGLEEAAEWIADDGVLDVKRIDSLRTLLSEVKALSLTTDKLLKSLGFDAMPSSFTEFSEEIDVLKVFLDKSMYIEAKDFLLSTESRKILWLWTLRICQQRSASTKWAIM